MKYQYLFKPLDTFMIGKHVIDKPISYLNSFTLYKQAAATIPFHQLAQHCNGPWNLKGLMGIVFVVILKKKVSRTFLKVNEIHGQLVPCCRVVVFLVFLAYLPLILRWVYSPPAIDERAGTCVKRF